MLCDHLALGGPPVPVPVIFPVVFSVSTHDVTPDREHTARRQHLEAEAINQGERSRGCLAIKVLHGLTFLS